MGGTLSVPPHRTAPDAALGTPGTSERHTSNGDSLCWQQSSRAYTRTSLTPVPGATSTDSHGSSTLTSLMQKFHPFALPVMPSMHLLAERSWPARR